MKESVTPYWYAIYTKPREEYRAESNLRAWNVETFAPKAKELRYNKLTGEFDCLTAPLFPRYIFARFDADQMFHKIYFTRGVHSVVMVGNKPAPVDDKIISTIRSQIADDGLVRIGNDLKPGDKVVVKDGSLKGLTGIFKRNITNTDRVMILLTTVTYHANLIIARQDIRGGGDTLKPFSAQLVPA